MSNMQLDTLRRIVQEINASTSMHESLDIMVNQVAEAMHVDVCSIYLLDVGQDGTIVVVDPIHKEAFPLYGQYSDGEDENGKLVSNRILKFSKNDLCTRQISQNPYPIRVLPS